MPVKNIVETIRDTIAEEMRRDGSVVITGEDVGPRGGVFRATQGLYNEFGPERVIDSPLSESSIIAVGIGMALHGLRPICEIQFADFIYPAMNQIVSEAALMRYRTAGTWSCPMVIRAPYGGGIGGGLYHSQSIEATFAHFPGIYVVAPATPYDAKGLLRAALQADDPVLFLENKKSYRLVRGDVPNSDYMVAIGRADVKRAGSDLSVFCYGLMLHECLKAADSLAGDGIDVEIVDLRTIQPLDKATILESVRKTSKVLIVHEDNLTFGVGAEVAALIAAEAFHDLDAPVMRYGAPDIPAVPFSLPMQSYFMPDARRIGEAMRWLAEY
ncbi:MAG: alpha-ketoacid dehydrogenase subunit beta [Caldilineae bacterium]|nr:alpha-ketoacid dehydrogenase subunit beta [Anaerolineae bacterium]MCB0199562.1 alpha-ketoacid dehydrogenase subunit beta [Anaerolineae bacterium]MCB0204903.1 alpha-ketoacid dehydrogenase subunit beta [Anaerolineae bacterium]MCB0254861.1 alpha-ketoacid dehydrogenase subunit beta [Anaerolineae bacterium]MCB9153099.1 alpha-ketoacid dehydrogenase subunit beta [Caldilineae bacterium]